MQQIELKVTNIKEILESLLLSLFWTPVVHRYLYAHSIDWGNFIKALEIVIGFKVYSQISNYYK